MIKAEPCLGTLDPPKRFHVEHMECAGETGVFCLDFDNAKKLAAQLSALWLYVDAAHARCMPQTTEENP